MICRRLCKYSCFMETVFIAGIAGKDDYCLSSSFPVDGFNVICEIWQGN